MTEIRHKYDNDDKQLILFCVCLHASLCISYVLLYCLSVSYTPESLNHYDCYNRQHLASYECYGDGAPPPPIRHRHNSSMCRSSNYRSRSSRGRRYRHRQHNKRHNDHHLSGRHRNASTCSRVSICNSFVFMCFYALFTFFPVLYM